jgi:hypothetical protein
MLIPFMVKRPDTTPAPKSIVVGSPTMPPHVPVGGAHVAVAVPRHAPAASHTSEVVHASPSSQRVPGADPSITNARVASSQRYRRHPVFGPGAVGTPPREHPRESAPVAPGVHISAPVHHIPSSHVAWLGVWLATPPAQRPTVHAIPSSGTSVSSAVATHPITASQRSRVQGLRSSQTTLAPPAHTPARQVSPERHTPVEHEAPSARGVYTQRPPVNASSVQGLRSSHMGV